MPRRHGAFLAALAVSLLMAAGCGGNDAEAGGEPLTVFAAASLTEVLPQIDPGARYNFAGSDELAAQIREGAPADVFASASAGYTDELFDEGLVDEPQVFATNRLVLIVPQDNPADIERVDDVAAPGVKLVVAAESVPVGGYTRELLETLRLERALENVVSNEDDVKGVVAKVALGEAEAGFVYATDAAAAAGDVGVVELPAGAQPPIEYTIARVTEHPHAIEAQAFIDLVLSPEGQELLREAGFGPPSHA
jgi:molybdate transport system substrate-binding protein